MKGDFPTDFGLIYLNIALISVEVARRPGKHPVSFSWAKPISLIVRKIEDEQELVSTDVQSTWASGSCLCPPLRFIIGSLMAMVKEHKRGTMPPRSSKIHVCSCDTSWPVLEGLSL